jgi:hypothetical protein
LSSVFLPLVLLDVDIPLNISFLVLHVWSEACHLSVVQLLIQNRGFAFLRWGQTSKESSLMSPSLLASIILFVPINFWPAFAKITLTERCR